MSIYLVNECIHHTNTNSQFFEDFSNHSPHIYTICNNICKNKRVCKKTVYSVSLSSFCLHFFTKESDDPNSTSGLTAWFNRQHEEVEVPTGDDPWIVDSRCLENQCVFEVCDINVFVCGFSRSQKKRRVFWCLPPKKREFYR